MSPIQIHRLIDHPPALDVLAGWIDAEWGAFSGRSRDETRARFVENLSSSLPCSFVALDQGNPVGVASLRTCDSVDWDAAAGPWVCNVYVPPHARGRGVASLLCRHLERHAAGWGFPALFLASIEGDDSLYHRLGYRTYRTVRHGGETFHLMKLALAAPEER